MIPLLQRFAWLCDIDGPGWVSVMEVLVEIDRCHQLPEWCAWRNGAERPVVTSLACGTELVGPPHMVLLVVVAVCGAGEECRHELLSNGLVFCNGCHQLGNIEPSLANARCPGIRERILVAVESSTSLSQKSYPPCLDTVGGSCH